MNIDSKISTIRWGKMQLGVSKKWRNQDGSTCNVEFGPQPDTTDNRGGGLTLQNTNLGGGSSSNPFSSPLPTFTTPVIADNSTISSGDQADQITDESGINPFNPPTNSEASCSSSGGSGGGGKAVAAGATAGTGLLGTILGSNKSSGVNNQGGNSGVNNQGGNNKSVNSGQGGGNTSGGNNSKSSNTIMYVGIGAMILVLTVAIIAVSSKKETPIVIEK